MFLRIEGHPICLALIAQLSEGWTVRKSRVLVDVFQIYACVPVDVGHLELVLIDSLLRGAILLEYHPLVLRLLLFRMRLDVADEQRALLELVRNLVQVALHTALELVVLEVAHEVEVVVVGVRREYLLARLREVLGIPLQVQ